MRQDHARRGDRASLVRVGASLAALPLVWGVLVAPEAGARPRATAQPCTPVDQFRTAGLNPSHGGGAAVAGTRFGAAITTGDFDGDGHDDLAVGAPRDLVGGARAGAVYVFTGTSSGPARPGTRLTQANIGAGDEAGDRFGSSLASADFNADGYDDLAIGIPGEAVGSRAGAGAIAFFLGSAGGLSSSGEWEGQEPLAGLYEAGDGFGFALAAADFDADGYDDLAIGVPGEAPGSSPASGVVSVFRGSTSPFTDGYGVNQEGNGGVLEAGDRFGEALATGDVNGDGVADLAVGAPGEAPGSRPRGGAAFLIRGSTGGLGNGYVLIDADVRGAATEAGDRFGAALAIGNFNGDAYDDIAIGKPGEAPGPHPRSGGVGVFPGRAGAGRTGFGLNENRAGEVLENGSKFGARLATGDVDGDELDDLLVGAPNKSPGSAATSGAAYLFGGNDRRPGRSLDRGRRLIQSELGWGVNEGIDDFGSSVVFGDLTGDGIDEVVIGVAGEAPGSNPAMGSVAYVEGLITGVSLGGLVGAVSDTSVRVWARGNNPGSFRVQYRPSGTTGWTTGPHVPFGDVATRDLTAVARLSGLAPGTTYEYRLAVGCRIDHLTAADFRTLPSPSASGRVRFGYSADTIQPQERGQTPLTLFNDVARRDLDFMILGGDNIYGDAGADSTTAAQYFEDYQQNWGEVNYRSFMSEFPTFMIWDDHEIRNNWDEGTSPARYREALRAYQAYQGSHNPAPRRDGVIYYSFRAGPADFYVLDTRSYRSPERSDGQATTMLGATQLADLKSWLTQSDAPFKVIVSSVAFSDLRCPVSASAFDSWCGYQPERSGLLDYIEANDIRNVVVVSGDSHWSGAFVLNTPDHPVHEFMPTPLGIGAAVPPGNRQTPPDQRLLWNDTGRHQAYAMFDVDTTASPQRITVTFRTHGNQILHREVVEAT